MDAAGERLIELLEAAIRPNVSVAYGSHPYIAAPPSLFIATLKEIATLTRGRRFLDVGSGLGSKLVLAKLLGFQPSGIEVVPEYVAFSRKLIECPVVEADAFTFADWHRFDVIYCYRPFVELPREQLLERRIVEGMRMGQIVWFPHTGDYAHIRSRCVELSPGVFERR